MIDELDKNNAADVAHKLKIWCSPYWYQPEKKFGNVHVKITNFIVTCNWSPEEFFEGLDPKGTLEPILQRFDVKHVQQSHGIGHNLQRVWNSFKLLKTSV